MENELNRWYKKLWETKGSRFIAAKRYERHEKWSTITISLVSIYIICINLLVFVPNRPPILSEINITLSTISLSILVIVISIILNNMSYKHLSHRFHDCGREITIVYDKLCLLKADSEKVRKEDLEEITNQYNSILRKYDINHTPLDYYVFQKNNIKEYSNITYPYLFQFWIFLRYQFDTLGRYVIFILIPIALYFIFIKPSA
ncbi:SLATT domain-containing protein [Galbibacter sp. EGI 63066]|uniref:SLATT domain-containing protein n=1 Tax=Galbibacter sp. EGI 63066 TaxID=2993559 RepID=UPI0022497701|nr:SLATT domain-containing protein [Galbibacter sp. EGI 63066]MCX2680267.1 SLATT domain-containing protein [Galbibacter sp. EGI 63066]